jgi:hypothetical protein
MAPDGEIGEPAYAISDGVVETLPPSLNFLTVTGEFCEGQILTASYGYIGGHEGNSLYSWHLHEVCYVCTVFSWFPFGAEQQSLFFSHFASLI